MGTYDAQEPQPTHRGAPINAAFFLLSSTFSKGGSGQNEQASPQVISAGVSQKQIPACTGSTSQPNCNFTLYKFTIRNPPFHTVGLHGKNVTIWGVKVQSPWNIPNTDGFDIDASNVTVYDTTVANGDQQLVFVAAGTPMQDITVDKFHGYTKGGITILGNGISVANLVARNLQFTGDLPSVSGTTVNGVTQEEMKAKYGLNTYAQAYRMPRMIWRRCRLPMKARTALPLGRRFPTSPFNPPAFVTSLGPSAFSS